MRRQISTMSGGLRQSQISVDETIVRIAPGPAHALANAYRRAGGRLQEADLALDPLVRQAGDLLEQFVERPLFGELGVLLGDDATDLQWRIDYLEATDGIETRLSYLRALTPLASWWMRDASDVTPTELAVLLAHVEDPTELERVLDWMFATGAFESGGLLRGQPEIPSRFRGLFASVLSTAYNSGWRPDDGEVPPWLAAGMAQHGDLSDASFVELGRLALRNDDGLGNSAKPNPFGVDREQGEFGPFAAGFVAQPHLGRSFIESLMSDFDRTGDTLINMHEDGSPRAAQLADIVGVVGTSGTELERTAFVDRLVRTINADGDTNEPVFWATWAVHAELALEHDIVTTGPTFDVHRLLPDSLRPAWEQTWHNAVTPYVLNKTFEFVNETKAKAELLDDVTNPGKAVLDWAAERYGPTSPGNDAGGTYTTRPKSDFHGLRWHFSDADRGRNVITHALLDSSNRGDIFEDEFAIIDHGIGANGKPTYTINLPGVIDLSDPVAGFDPVHSSVRDMDQAALRSATSSRVEDNLYAQMVIRALATNDIPLGSNLMIVGHSFGADAAADLAANTWFTASYNVTHVVAAGYDSAPQLAHISPDIDVLVLQNEDDKAILLEASQRSAAMSLESVSINTFAHEVREFDGGWGTDIGHHQDRYINYLEESDDAELTRFYESVAAVGYGDSGTSVAIDVTLDESLR
ncbi:MAG: hypothetical protein ACI81L_002674 [Verrucomicrobiales bacterium]|jgi:hypothetical protein